MLKEVWDEEPTDPLIDQTTLQEMLDSDLFKTNPLPPKP